MMMKKQILCCNGKPLSLNKSVYACEKKTKNCFFLYTFRFMNMTETKIQILILSVQCIELLNEYAHLKLNS